MPHWDSVKIRAKRWTFAMNIKEMAGVILLLVLTSALFYYIGAATGNSFFVFISSSPWLRLAMVFILMAFLISMITFAVWAAQGSGKTPPPSSEEH